MNAEFVRPNGTKEITGLKPGRLFVGSAVKWELSEPRKINVAWQIYSNLLARQDRMRVISPGDLVASMNNSRFVLRLGEQNELLGCAQIWPLPQNPRVIEVGTWLGHKHPDYENGSGALVMRHAAQLGMIQPGSVIAIALIKEDNTKAKEVLADMGGIDIGSRLSDYVTEGDGQPSRMRVFNLVNLLEQ